MMEQMREDPAGAHVKDYLSMVWGHKWLCLLAFVVFSSAGLFVSYRLVVPMYEAHALLGFVPLRGPELLARGGAGESFYQAQFQQLQSSKVAAVAAAKLGWSPSAEMALDDKSAQAVMHSVKIVPEMDTRCVTILTKQPKAEDAARIVNTVVDAFIEVAKESEIRRDNELQAGLQGQIIQMSLQLEQKKTALAEFSRDKDLQSQQQQQMIMMTRLTALSEAKVRAEVARQQAEDTYNELKKNFDNNEDIADTTPSPAAESLRMRLMELKQELKVMESTSGKTPQALLADPRHQTLVAQISTLDRDYSDTVEESQKQRNQQMLDAAHKALQQSVKVEEMMGVEMGELRAKLDELAQGLSALARYNDLKKGSMASRPCTTASRNRCSTPRSATTSPPSP